MQRALSSYPLAGGVLAKLAAAGFQTGADLSGVGVAELSKGRLLPRSDVTMHWTLILHCCYSRLIILYYCIELSVSRAEALEVLKTVCEGGGTPSKPPACGISALDLLKAEQLQKYIVTFCAKFDSMLGGGVPLGRITEICGVPGVGKTQFGYVRRCSMNASCLQCLPKCLNGAVCSWLWTPPYLSCLQEWEGRRST